MSRSPAFAVVVAAACALPFATTAGTSYAAPAPSTTIAPSECTPTREHPDLGTMRARDPSCRRAVWLGADTAGVAAPARLGLSNESVWVLRGAGAWSVRLARWASVGGRHGGTMFSSGSTRLGVREHRVEAAFHPWATRRSDLHDRLMLGLETHALARAHFDGTEIRPGGVRDLVVSLGYGVDHPLSRRWSLAWQVHGRHAWLYRATQRQALVGARLGFTPVPAHRLEIGPSVFVVHRDVDQGGRRLPRLTANAQVAASWSWMSRKRVGVFVGGRYASAFLTGEAPMYELRSESLQQHYAEAQLGLRAVWR